MAFHLKETDIELGSTPVENVFIDQFLPSADGNYIKVYLMAYKYAVSKKNNIKFDNNHLAKLLQLTLTDVINAWKYWENAGVVELKYEDGIPADPDNSNFDIIFKNLTELYIDSLYANKYEQHNIQPSKSSVKGSSTPNSDDLIASFQNPALSKMFKELDDSFRRSLNHNERLNVLEFIDEFGMDPDVVSKAFYISAEEKGIRSIKYALGILRNWHDMGIRSFKELEEMLKNKSNRHYQYLQIKKSIGSINTNPTPVEKKTMDRWIDEWNYSMDLIMKACEKSSNTTNPSIAYINGILSDWNDKNLRTLEDIEENEKRHKEEKNKIKSNKDFANNNSKEIKSKFHNFPQASSQYSDEELEKILRKGR